MKSQTSKSWESLEDYQEAMKTYERFPIDSGPWYVASIWRTSIFVFPRAGEYSGVVTGIYTLEEARKIILESATEYEAAMRLVTSWEHWNAIRNQSKNKKVLDEMFLEKELLEITKTKKLLWKAAQSGNVSAQKILLEELNKEKNTIKARRSENQQQLVKQEEEQKKVEAIKNTLRLIKNNA
jgi:hypothetical protein